MSGDRADDSWTWRGYPHASFATSSSGGSSGAAIRPTPGPIPGQ